MCRLCHDLMLLIWPLYADFRRLGRRFAKLTSSPIVRMRLEHVTDDCCRKFDVDAVGLRLVCTYAGPGTEWIDPARPGPSSKLGALATVNARTENYFFDPPGVSYKKHCGMFAPICEIASKFDPATPVCISLLSR